MSALTRKRSALLASAHVMTFTQQKTQWSIEDGFRRVRVTGRCLAKADEVFLEWQIGSWPEYFLSSLGKMLLIFIEMRLKYPIFRKYHSFFFLTAKIDHLGVNIEFTLRYFKCS